MESRRSYLWWLSLLLDDFTCDDRLPIIHLHKIGSATEARHIYYQRTFTMEVDDFAS